MKPSPILVLINAAVLFASSAAAQTCSPSSNVSNFNGTSIEAGTYIWFNANFTASGIPSSGATISFAGSTISFTTDKPYGVTVPNAQITFDPNAACATTTFDMLTNTWMTTVPLAGSDEIFLTGLAFPVPLGFSRVNGPVTWLGTFTSATPGISVAWKWGAAVYKTFSSDYNVLGIKPTHTLACPYNNSDHAGTPEAFKAFVIGGARGGGGSNWTGSWSGTAGVSVCFSSPVTPG